MSSFTPLPNAAFQQILAAIQQPLQTLHLKLDPTGIEQAYREVEQFWHDATQQISKTSFLIVGEATQNLRNYFYQPGSNSTSFLSPEHFDQPDKPALINWFTQQNIMVFDLYPLPLPTFLYDANLFDSHDPGYASAMESYFDSKLQGRLNPDSTIVLRYTKLAERPEWPMFEQYLNKQGVTIIKVRESFIKKGKTLLKDVPLHIAKGIRADPEKIRQIFPL